MGKSKTMTKTTKGKTKIKNNFKSTYQEQKILKILDISCKHREHYYGGGTVTCESACALIIQEISGGLEFSNLFLIQFLKKVTESRYTSYYYSTYSSYTCIKQNGAVISNAIDEIVKLTVPDNDNLLTMIKYSDLDKCFITLAEKNPYFKKFSQEFILSAIEERFEYECYDGKDEHCSDADIDTMNKFCNIIIDNADMNDNLLAELCTCRNVFFDNVLANYIDKYEGKLSQKMLTNACKSLPYTKNIIKILLSRNLSLTDDDLDIICEFCNEESIKFILDETRIKPKKSHFQKIVQSKTLLSNRSYEERKKYSYRYSNNINRYENGAYTPNKAEILIAYGFKPTYDDVMFGIVHKAEIPNIARFSIKPDKKMLEKCWDYDFYPEYDFDCIKKEMIGFQKLCNKRAKVQISKYLKKHDLVPDRKCMENACTFKNNHPIVNLLKSKGGKITIKCIENCAKQFSANSMLVDIIKTYKDENQALLDNYEKRIKELEEKLKNNETLGTEKVEAEETTNNNKQEEDMMDELKSQIMDNDLSDIEIESDEELIVAPKNKTKEAKTDSLDDGIFDEDLEELINENEMIVISDVMIKNKPKQLRKKCTIPKKYAKYFKKKSNQKMSFLDIKKEFLDTIKKKKWYDSQNQTLLDPPKNLRKVLKIKMTGYIDFNDVDKLVYLFYN